VTFSGLLNALDGVASAEERIIFMTTNHLDRLDPALIRPGRVDLLEKIDDASPAQVKRLFVRFYGDEADAQTADKLEEIVRDEMQRGRRASMASIQGHFIRSKPKEAVESCQSLFAASPSPE
jgi:mitochondrial chaperone BCS1